MKIIPDVVVIGRNYSTSLGVIRAVGFAGYYVDVVKHGKSRFTTPELKSKFVKNHFSASESTIIEVLINEIAEKNHKKVIIPADDLTVTILDNNADRLLEYFIIPQLNGKNGAFMQAMDKGIQKEIAIRCGLPVTKGWTVDIDGKGAYAIPKNMCYPCYTKPQISIGSPKTYIRKCNNEKELRMLLDKVAKEGANVILVEEYLEIDKEYDVPGLSCEGKTLLPAFIEKIKIGEGAHKGVTAIGKIIDAANWAETSHLLKEYISQFGLTGLFDIELIESKGTIYFNELNLRNSAASFGITSAGVNLPGKLVDFLLKNKITSDLDALKNGIMFASEKSLFENYEAGYCSWKQYKLDKKSVDFSFIKCNEDMAPYRTFVMLTMRKRLKKIIKSLLGH